MDFGNFTSSPSASPNNTIFSTGAYFDSTSESSSPNSPVSKASVIKDDRILMDSQHLNQLVFNGSMPYDMYQYGATPATYFATSQANKIPVEYSSSTFNEKDRRRKRSSVSSKDGEKESVSNAHLRRRAQNRASQRAFRERKEKHVKGLENQLEELHEKHQDLLQSYTKQADEVTRLNARIAELSAELSTVRNCQDSSFSDMMTTDKFDKFDAFSSTEMMYHGPDCYFDKQAVDLNSEFALHSFEDSL